MWVDFFVELYSIIIHLTPLKHVVQWFSYIHWIEQPQILEYLKRMDVFFIPKETLKFSVHHASSSLFPPVIGNHYIRSLYIDLPSMRHLM